MAKLISAKLGRKGAGPLILPHVGKVVFDENGIVEVDDEIADQVIESTKDSIELILVESLAENETAQLTELEQELSKMKSSELLEMVRESSIDIPVDKLASFTDAKLVKLLVAEFKKQDAQDIKEEKVESKENDAVNDTVSDVVKETETKEKEEKKESKKGFFGLGKPKK